MVPERGRLVHRPGGAVRPEHHRGRGRRRAGRLHLRRAERRRPLVRPLPAGHAGRPAPAALALAGARSRRGLPRPAAHRVAGRHQRALRRPGRRPGPPGPGPARTGHGHRLLARPAAAGGLGGAAGPAGRADRAGQPEPEPPDPQLDRPRVRQRVRAHPGQPADLRPVPDLRVPGPRARHHRAHPAPAGGRLPARGPQRLGGGAGGAGRPRVRRHPPARPRGDRARAHHLEPEPAQAGLRRGPAGARLPGGGIHPGRPVQPHPRGPARAAAVDVVRHGRGPRAVGQGQPLVPGGST